MSKKKIIQVEEKVPKKLLLPLSLQHMFAMFGASVLVPFLFGINPAIVLFIESLSVIRPFGTTSYAIHGTFRPISSAFRYPGYRFVLP